MDYYIYDGKLYHHGVKGQRWGVRRFQNKDGSLTASGKKRKRNAESDKTDKASKANKLITSGKSHATKHSKIKVSVAIASAATIASGALWVASALVPGAPIFNTMAAVANVVSIAASKN